MALLLAPILDLLISSEINLAETIWQAKKDVYLSHRAIRVTVTDYRRIDMMVLPDPGTLSALDRTDVSMMESQLSARQTKRS